MNKYLVYLLILFALFFRLWDLANTPFGLDTDESYIWFWGSKALELKEFWIYSPALSWHWEMLPGYFYALVGSYISPRYFMSFWGIGECLLFYILLKRHTKKDVAILASLIFALLPWHIYYTRLIGTCGGILFFMLLASLFFRNKKYLWLIDVLGLAYYTSYRILFIAQLVLAFIKKQKTIIVSKAAGLSIFLLLLYISKSPVMQFFTRGSYNLKPFGFNYLYNAITALFVAFIPPLPYYKEMGDHFLEGPLHLAFVKSLGYFPPGALASLLALLGLIYFLYKREKSDQVTTYAVLWFFTVWISFSILGPSYGHFLIVAPSVAILAAYFLRNFPSQILTFLTFFTLIWANFQLINRLQNRQLMEPHFNGRAIELIAILEEKYPQFSIEKKIVSGHFIFPVIENLAYRRKSFLALDPIDPYQLFAMLKQKYAAEEILFTYPQTPLAKEYDTERIYYQDLEKKLQEHELIDHREIYPGIGTVYHLNFSKYSN